MKVLSDRAVIHDGAHNMAPRFVFWRGNYWMVFRSGDSHRSTNGRVVIMRSPDMTIWSGRRVVIDTPFDDRDPSVFLCNDRLFVVSLSVDREWKDQCGPFGVLKTQGDCTCHVTFTDDGEMWSQPKQVVPSNYVIWWPLALDGSVFAAVQRRIPDSSDPESLKQQASNMGLRGCSRPLEFVNRIDRQAELWSSRDGLNWKQVSIICDRDQASETALSVLPDGRMVGFVRHDDHCGEESERNRPEIVVADPPYHRWASVYRFGFRTNGPCLGLVGDELVTCSRAFFEDPRTPLNSEL